MSISINRTTKVAALAVVVALAALWAFQSEAVTARERVARATVHDADGQSLGTVQFIERRGEVQVRASLSGLTPGFHGFHIHQTGVCEPPFTSAGGHYNPGGASHSDHAGDMPSLYVKADGSADLQFSTDRFTVSELVAGQGRAVMVHADPDNFGNIPERYFSTTEEVNGPDSATLATGDAGGRVGCGVIGR